MIPAGAIDAYLNRELDDHLWVKKLTHKELDKALAELEPAPFLYPELRLHQKASILLGIAYPQFAFWLDMGSGKTLITLELLQFWYETGVIEKALVFVTSDKAYPTWENQVKFFNIQMPYTTLEGSSEEKWRSFDQAPNGLIFVTYPGAVAMCSKRVGGKRKGKLQLDPTLIKRFTKGVGALVMDESTKAGHHTSLTHKLCGRIRRKVDICYALAGRPFGRDPTLLWAQQYLVDQGETLGETLGLFREAFFSSSENRWSGFPEYTFKKSMQPELSRLLQHRSITYSAEECIDLPKHQVLIEEVHLPDEAEAYYKKVKDQVIAAKGNLREMKNAFVRMRQLSSGFMGFKDDDTGEKAEIEFADNPKLDRLMELIEGLPDGRKAVVFYEFTWSGRKIFEQAKAMKLKPIWLWSGTKDSRGEIKRFMENDDCTVAVVNNRVGAYSLDGMQIANYCFFYESPVSVIDREQAERRVRRQGQTRKVFQYDLVVSGTMDKKILAFHREGEDLFNALLKDPSTVLG
jgi:SNF2 family DNA or RNA helicase